MKPEELAIALGLGVLLTRLAPPNITGQSDPAGSTAAAQAATLAAAIAAATVLSNSARVSAIVSSTILTLGATGLVAPGPVALVGANVGARVVAVLESGLPVNPDFEAVITIQNQIQQTGGVHATSLAVFLQGP